MTLYREEGSNEDKCVCNSQALFPLVLEGANFFPKIILGGGGGRVRTKLGFLKGAHPTRGHLQLLRGIVGGKKGMEPWRMLCNWYAHSNFSFKVLLIAVDGLWRMYREGGRVYLQKYACVFRGRDGQKFPFFCIDNKWITPYEIIFIFSVWMDQKQKE